MGRWLLKSTRIAIELGVAAINWHRLAWVYRGRAPLPWQALWQHRLSRRLLRILNVRWESLGHKPSSGLVVCNHLSYLDILVIAATTPAVFVSKADVRAWPVFGWLAAQSGTIFVNREQRMDVRRVRNEMGAALRAGVPVVVFPEGTSSDGQTVLPFRSPLLASAVESDCPITTAHLHYELPGGSAAREVCYWGDMVFTPHLSNLLLKERITAKLVMKEWRGHARHDRKLLAHDLRRSVLQLQSEQQSKAPPAPANLESPQMIETRR